METQKLQSQLILLEKRLRRAERGLLMNTFGWITMVVVGVLLIWIKTFGAVHAQSEKLRLREVDIVDQHGRERIVIASPLPDPVVKGKVEHRVRVVSAGVQFKAPDGTEQGGIALSDDGSFMFGIDDESGRERAHLYYIPKRGSGIYLQGGETARQRFLCLFPPEVRTQNWRWRTNPVKPWQPCRNSTEESGSRPMKCFDFRTRQDHALLRKLARCEPARSGVRPEFLNSVRG